MAMILETFIPNLISVLTRIVSEEELRPLMVSGEGKKLQITLRELNSIDVYISLRSRDDLADMSYVSDLKYILYYASNLMDLFQLELDKRRRASAVTTGFRNLLYCIVRHKHDTALALLNEGLKEVFLRSDMFRHRYRLEYSDASRIPAVPRVEPSSVILSSDIFGEQVEQDMMALIEIMHRNRGNPDIMIIAIVGAAGIGKSALARRTFDSIRNEFDAAVWLTVTGRFSVPDLLRTILRFLDGDVGSHDTEGISYPLYKIQELVQAKRILLVLDDVWDTEVSEILRSAFKHNAYSVILVTTRDGHVAAAMRAEHVHRVNRLSNEASWSLLKKEVASGDIDEQQINRLRDIGLEIVEKCDCSPLAIKMVAEELRKKNKTKSAWVEALKDHKWSEKGLPRELNASICLSFDDLPTRLKSCFLYCCLFAEREVINCDKVVQMLMAEGFFLSDGRSNLPEASGLSYFEELLSRNLLEPSGGNYYQSHCAIMPNVFRSFALYIARDEALLVEDSKITSARCTKLQRVSVSNKGAEFSDLQTHKSIRALISFGSMVIKPSDSLSTVHLRILHVNKTKLCTLVDSMHHLKHLRYLDLSNTDVSALPHDIGKMKNLQYICLQGCQNLAHLPKSIVNLEMLRYLDISETKVTTIPRDFGKLKNLVTLKGFPAYVDDSAKNLWIIEELVPLHKLMHLTIRGPENISSISSFICAKLAGKMHLRSLWICCTSSDAYEQHNQEYFYELCPSPSLEDLTIPSLEDLIITGYFGRHLPGFLWSSTFENLRFLKLENLRSCTQLPCSFGQLHNLESLCIKHALSIRRIGEEFFVHSSALVSDSDAEEVNILVSRYYYSRTASAIVFPKLKKLVFYGLLQWKEWDWDAQLEAMHALESLQISRCRLSRLPPGLACQTMALRVLTIEMVKDLISAENFISVVELYLHSLSNLEKIANLPKMKKLKVSKCPKLKVLEEVNALSSLELKDHEMRTLPGYLQVLQLSKLQIECNLRLLHFISLKDAALEWDNIRHIEQVEAYADGYQENKRCSVLYTKSTGSFVAYMSDSPESAASDEPESSSEQQEEE